MLPMSQILREDIYFSKTYLFSWIYSFPIKAQMIQSGQLSGDGRKRRITKQGQEGNVMFENTLVW